MELAESRETHLYRGNGTDPLEFLGIPRSPTEGFFCEFIEQMHSQCFITCVDSQSLPYTWQPDTPVAHYSIEDGQITCSSPCLET